MLTALRRFSKGLCPISLFEIILIAIALAMDALAVSLAVGLHLGGENNAVHPRQYFRLAFHFGLFQFMMPILGWLAGSSISSYIESFDHWIAMVLLSYIGIKMIRESFGSEKYNLPDPTKGLSLVLLSVATSIDALATGLSLAVLGTDIIYPSIMIGLVAAIFTLCGLALGRKLGARWRRGVAFVGGLILIGIGLKILVEHTL